MLLGKEDPRRCYSVCAPVVLGVLGLMGVLGMQVVLDIGVTGFMRSTRGTRAINDTGVLRAFEGNGVPAMLGVLGRPWVPLVRLVPGVLGREGHSQLNGEDVVWTTRYRPKPA